MKISPLISTISLFITLASSHELRTTVQDDKHNRLISTQEASAFVDKYFDLLRNIAPVSTAQNLFTDDLEVYSHSRLSVRGAPHPPPGITQATSLADYLTNYYPATGLSASTSAVFSSISINADGTDFTWYWAWDGVGDGKYPVHGYTRFAIKYLNRRDWKVEMFVHEFNSVAWLINTGGHVTYRNGTVE